MPQASFDAYAEHYDAGFTNSRIGQIQRRQVMSGLLPLLNRSQQVLEINCGTGYDAVQLAPLTGPYLATDLSEQMIRQCKARPGSQQPNLRFETKAIQALRDELQERDLVFSNFGGLNCLSPEEFKSFAKTCTELMPEGSSLFLVIMGRACVWEQLYFLLKGDFKKAFRRARREGFPTRIADAGFLTWYYSPGEVKRFFAPGFRLQRKRPVALFVPPSYLEPFFAKRPALLRILRAMDTLILTFGFLSKFADHYYLHLKKQP